MQVFINSCILLTSSAKAHEVRLQVISGVGFLNLTLPTIFELFAIPNKMTEDGDASIFLFKAHESTGLDLM